MKNKSPIVLMAIIAIGILSVSAGVYAMPLMSTQVAPNATASKISTYVLVDGGINASGTNAAVGTIQAQSRTTVGPMSTIQGFSSTAVWSTNTSRPLATAIKRQNFTYTFYTARLINGSYSALDFNGANFYLNGTWNVWNVTETFTIITDSTGNVLNVNSNQNAVKLANNATGEFTANAVGENFTLAITGVMPVTGTVTFERETSRLFNPIILSQDSTTTTVTPSDLESIIGAYGAMPGFGNYDARMDYCLHYKIDICDLATAAANLNQ